MGKPCTAKDVAQTSSLPYRSAYRLRGVRGPATDRGVLDRAAWKSAIQGVGKLRYDDEVRDVWQSRRLEMMNGSKTCGPSGGPQTPSPKRRRPRLRESCSPSPQPSPLRRGRNVCPCFGDTTGLGYRAPTKRNPKKRGLQPQRPNFPAPCQGSPSPWGEGWGEGKRTELQPKAQDDPRNCQTSRVPRRSHRFPNLAMTS